METDKTVKVSGAAKKSLTYLKQTPNTDLILLVEGKKLFVNKTILTFASPVWAKMLTADFKEKDASEIELPGKKVLSVVAFLRCVYPNILDEIDNENVYQVLPLAEEYRCHILKEKCEKYFVNFLSIQKTVDPVLKSLLASSTYDLKRSLDVSANILCNRLLSTLESNRTWNEVPAEAKFLVCKRRSKLLEESAEKIKTKLEKIQTGSTCRFCGESNTLSFNVFYELFQEIKRTNKKEKYYCTYLES